MWEREGCGRGRGVVEVGEVCGRGRGVVEGGVW